MYLHLDVLDVLLNHLLENTIACYQAVKVSAFTPRKIIEYEAPCLHKTANAIYCSHLIFSFEKKYLHSLTYRNSATKTKETQSELVDEKCQIIKFFSKSGILFISKAATSSTQVHG